MDNQRVETHGAAKQMDQLLEGENVGAGGIDDLIRSQKSGLDQQRGVVAHVHRLQPVAAVARDPEHREVPEQPGDVVDQHVALAKEQGGTDDRVRQA